MSRDSGPTAAGRPQQKLPAFSLFPKIPGPLQRLFDAVPLVTYPPNHLPARSPVRDGDLPTLHVFIHEADAARGQPSFNPTCLKWQTFLKIAGIDVRLSPSTNHASPSGALPFLLPPRRAASTRPVPASSFPIYAASLTINETSGPSSLPPTISGPLPAKHEAYLTLLDGPIRTAWLYTLYISPANTPLLTALYLAPASSSTLIQHATLHSLRRAARAEILAATGLPAVEVTPLLAAAQRAFAALDALLAADDDDHAWFSSVGAAVPGAQGPGMLDAAVFAYTHLLLPGGLEWEAGDGRLAGLAACPALVRHRVRMLREYWPELAVDLERTSAGGVEVGDSVSWEKV